MAERRITSLGEVCRLYDGPHATPTRLSEGPYFLNIASLNSGRLDLSKSDHVSIEDYKKWTRRVTPRDGDLLFSYETRLGEAALMPAGVRACLGRRMALLRPNTGVVEPRYLLYFYLSPTFQALIHERAIHGATVSRIALVTMLSWTIELPPLAEQRAVAEVLGALDDKITANDGVVRRCKDLMVALAGSTKKRARVGDQVTLSRNILPPQAFEPEIIHFSLPAYDEFESPRREKREEVKSGKVILSHPAVLIAKLNPRIPRIWDVGSLPEGMSVASTEFLALVPKRGGTSSLWAALSASRVAATLAQGVAGTSGSHQRVRPEDVLSLMIPDPEALSDRTRKTIDLLGEVVRARRSERQLLVGVRDELLPLLVLGKVRVRDAERVVSDAV